MQVRVLPRALMFLLLILLEATPMPEGAVDFSLTYEQLVWGAAVVGATLYPLVGAINAGIYARWLNMTSPFSEGEKFINFLTGAFWPVTFPAMVVYRSFLFPVGHLYGKVTAAIAPKAK